MQFNHVRYSHAHAKGMQVRGAPVVWWQVQHTGQGRQGRVPPAVHALALCVHLV